MFCIPGLAGYVEPPDWSASVCVPTRPSFSLTPGNAVTAVQAVPL